MASEYVLSAFEEGIKEIFAAEITGGSVIVKRVENDPDPDKIIGKSTAAQSKNYVLLRDQPTTYKQSALGCERAEELGSIDVHVAAPSGEKNRVAIVRDLVERIRARCVAGIDAGLTITTYDITIGPAAERFKGVWWGQSMAITFFHAG